MDKADLLELSKTLHELYGEKFPGLTPGMALLWLEELRHFDAPIVHKAVMQWARANTFRAPGLEELGRLAIEIADEHDEQRHRLQAQQRPAEAPSMESILQRAAIKDDTRWARLHLEMYQRGLTRHGHYAEAAAQCRAYAELYPEDRVAWLQEAAWWDCHATGTIAAQERPF